MKTLVSKLYRWLAIRRLIRRYTYLNEVDKLMEEFKTQQIIRGGSDEYIAQSRAQLINTQNSIKAQTELVEFLKGL